MSLQEPNLPDEESPSSLEKIAPSEVLDTIGKTPRFWGRNAVFVANLLGLFFGNEEETQMLADEVGEVDSYGGRLLPILNLIFGGKGKNLLVLEHEPDPDLAEYFQETANLTLPETAILPHRDYLALATRLEREEALQHPAVERIIEHSADTLDGYVTDETLFHLSQRLGKRTLSSVAGSRKGNNKGLLHGHLESVGLPTPVTEIAESPEQIRRCLAQLEKAGFGSAVIKAPMGASGIGMTKVNALNDCESIAASVPHHFFTEGPCLVQGWMKVGEFGVTRVRSPSVQLFLSEDAVSMYDMTEQILSHASVHEGNESPPPYLENDRGLREEILRQAAIAGRWLHEKGYRGTGSVDFIVTEKENGEFTVYVCEINARVTGATYPSVLARHYLPQGAWLLRNLRFSEPVSGKELLHLLDRSGDLYVPGKSEFGVFPVNFNFGKDGLIHKGQFLCLSASSEMSQELLHMAELDLPCAFDRD